MEPGKAWLRQPVAKVIARLQERGPIIASDQGSRRGHQCGKTSFMGEPGFIVSVGASPGCEPLPLGGKVVDPLDQ